MMMIGEGNHHNHHHHHHNQNHPTVHVPPWSSLFDESTAEMTTTMGYPIPVSGISSNINTGNASPGGGSGDYSPFLLSEALTALQRYLPSNEIMADSVAEDGMPVRESDIPVDTYSCDEFRMYEFKVRRCARGRSHDWTECPYAHPGEKARRRDPRKFHYSGTACPDFRKGNCKRGDTCEYAHGVFECWLHPARYRTQPCKDGTSCRRRVCFFAHTPEQLRVLPQQSPRGGGASESPPSYDGSPLRHALDSYFANGGGGGSCMLSSPTSTLMIPAPISPSDESEYSPPMSPTPSPLSRSLGSSSINEMVASLRNLQLNKVKSAPSSWGVQVGGSGFCSSPRGVSSLRPDFNSLPSTPTCTRSTATPTRSGGGGGVGGYLDFWDRCGSVEEEPVLERVESGRNLRAKIFEKLREENSLERGEQQNGNQGGGGPDVGWVSELIK